MRFVTKFLTLIILCGAAFGQAELKPFPKFRAFDSNGDPCSGCKLYAYTASTTTPLDTYTTAAGNVANTNPVILDANGEANVWLGSASYKLILKSSTDVQQWSVDNINAAVIGTGSLVRATSPTVTNISSNKYTSTVATGTAPLVVTSTTPVANLTGQILVYNTTGTQQANAHAVIGSCVLGTSCAVTLSGSAVFTGSNSYVCEAQDTTAAAATKIVYTSGTQFTITGTGTDSLTFKCVGN